jgi:hypothetical protein
MFGKKSVKLDGGLVEKIRKYAAIAGYSSPEEFITHALEKEISQLEGADSEEEIKKRLKGLGYIS